MLEDEFVLGDREPVHERLLAAMDDAIPFSMREVQVAFPTESYHVLYRALQRLEKERKLTFYKLVDRKKYYRKALTSDLPHIITSDGKPFPCSVFLEQPKMFSDSERRIWKQLDQQNVNKVPLLLAQLFVIANSEMTERERNNQWSLIRNELMEARRALTKAVDWIDSVTEHDSMSGNQEKFLNVFAGKDAPPMTTIHEFLRWVNKEWMPNGDA